MQEIEKLNNEIKCTLAPSAIHGIGVFALRDIQKGEKLFCTEPSEWYTVPFDAFSDLRSEIRDLILERWPLVRKGAPFLAPDVWLMSFMNHAEDANSQEDTALRDIAKGEEITEDYRLVADYQEIYPWVQ